jgi:hypothetical protein
MEHIHAYVVSTVNIHGRYSYADSAVSFRAAHFFISLFAERLYYEMGLFHE